MQEEKNIVDCYTNQDKKQHFQNEVSNIKIFSNKLAHFDFDVRKDISKYLT